MSKTEPTQGVLVTGGAGYLGSILVPLLLESGYRVRVLDLLYFGEQSLSRFAGNPNFELIREDLLYQENNPSLFDGIDLVVHLASISNDPTCDLDPNLTIRTNFIATMNLARRAKFEGVKRFVFLSSCSVYGATNQGLLDEQSSTGPVTLYALSKLESERELMKLSDKSFAVTVLRLATLFGLSPRMRFDLAINVMVKRCLHGESLLLNGTGEQLRPFLHVADAADSILKILQFQLDQIEGQIFNLANSEMNFSISQLVKTIQTFFSTIKIEQISENHDIRSYAVSVEKVSRQLGIKNSRNLNYAVNELCNAWRSGFLGDFNQKRFYNLSVMKEIEHGSFAVPCLALPSLALSSRWVGRTKAA